MVPDVAVADVTEVVDDVIVVDDDVTVVAGMAIIPSNMCCTPMLPDHCPLVDRYAKILYEVLGLRANVTGNRTVVYSAYGVLMDFVDVTSVAEPTSSVTR